MLQEAREVAAASNAPFDERVRAEWVRRRQVDVAMLRRGVGGGVVALALVANSIWDHGSVAVAGGDRG